MSVKGFLDKYFKVQPTESAKISPEEVLEPLVGTMTRKQMDFYKPTGITVAVAEKVDLPQPKVCHIFADGACSDNGKRNAKAGYGVHVYKDTTYDISRRLLPTEQQTNNRAELRAIQAALDLIAKHTAEWKETYSEYYIWTDSEYSINCLTKWAKGWKRNGWRKSDGKEILNLDLIQALYDRICLMPRVTFKHVRSHQNSTQFPYDGNHRADLLATESLRN